jgi:hypothetical protein
LRLATFLWGLAFLAAGAVLAFGWWPGSAQWDLGPRFGMAAVLGMLGLALLSGPLWRRIARRTAAIEGPGGGNCPVGATCSCGHFNFKPKRTCRACGRETKFPA